MVIIYKTKIKKSVLEKIIERYTRESGKRSRKQVAKTVRYAAKSIAMEEEYSKNPNSEELHKILGHQ